MIAMNAPEAWRAADAAASTAWRIEIDRASAREWAAAAKVAAADGMPVDRVDRRRFAVGQSRDLLERVHDVVENGVGFALLAGVPNQSFFY